MLIADDELNIREGIRDSVKWDSLEMVVVAEAEDGEEALELAIEKGIDLLLVDLNMPIMNGLTLVKQLRQKLPECSVLIITGYDEFSYAQEAIRLQVDDYILKPVKPENLYAVLTKISKKLVLQREETKKLQIATNHLSKNNSVIQERFCQEWVEGQMLEDEIIEQLHFLQLPEKAPKGLAVIHSKEFQLNQPLVTESDEDLAGISVKKIISNILADHPHVIFKDQNGLFFIIIWDDVTEAILTRIQKAIQTDLKITAHIYYEPFVGESMNLFLTYKSCKNKVKEESLLSPMVRRARNYIREHYTKQELTLEHVAQSLQTSAVYLSRSIKQELGITFVSLVTEMRMRKAIQLLNSTDLPVYEIAEQVGYDTQHYFSTAFKKAIGVSPNQYRKGKIKST